MAFVQSSVDKVPAFEMMEYKYRYYNEDSVQAYGKWLAGHDWSDLLRASGVTPRLRSTRGRQSGPKRGCSPWLLSEENLPILHGIIGR